MPWWRNKSYILMHPHGLALNFLPHKFVHRTIISTCSNHSKMAPLLNYFFFKFLVDSVISLTKNEKYPNRLFHNRAENEKPIWLFHWVCQLWYFTSVSIRVFTPYPQPICWFSFFLNSHFGLQNKIFVPQTGYDEHKVSIFKQL